ncbi:TnsD family Tn7-like transposition protein [Paraburkholderia caribensis]|uniref:TnsD family Tn7-like transposition protein n=1 Tax=Paraburkholderia caribensis TaxID=75105 RepID=UPI003426E604
MLKTIYPAARHETAFSLTVALANTTYDSEVRTALARAFRRATPLLHTAACRLERFCEMTSYAYGNPHDVLMEQTLYPLYLSCLSSAMGKQLELQVCFSTQHRLCCPGLPLPTQGANRYGLQCEECSCVSLRDTGRRCSLTFHCIPLLTRCPIHGCLFNLVDECSSHEISMRASYSPARRRNSHRLGEILLDFSQCTCSEAAVDRTRTLMREHGYLPEYGRLRNDEFTRDFLHALSKGFEDERLNIWIKSAGMLPQALRSLRRPERPAHPVAIALLLLALDVVEYSPPISAHLEADLPTRTDTMRSREDLRRKKRREWMQHIASHKDCTRSQARLLSPALWSWLYKRDSAWLEAHQTPPRPRTDRRPRAHDLQSIRTRVIEALRSSNDIKLRTRPKWRYRARINCGLPQRAFDRLITDRP